MIGSETLCRHQSERELSPMRSVRKSSIWLRREHDIHADSSRGLALIAPSEHSRRAEIAKSEGSCLEYSRPCRPSRDSGDEWLVNRQAASSARMSVRS